MSAPEDGSRGLVSCESCGLVAIDRLGVEGPRAESFVQRCIRCGHELNAIKPESLERTWACTIAAGVLYVPANAYAVMTTTSAGVAESHTLLGGIHELWIGGNWILAVIVFIASIAVPVLKIGALVLLAASVRYAPRWRRLERAKLYRLVEAVGHWSMLDVFVVVFLAATIRFGPLAGVGVGPGMLSFAAVVVLTMLAAHYFDPRLIWRDRAPGGAAVPQGAP